MFKLSLFILRWQSLETSKLQVLESLGRYHARLIVQKREDNCPVSDVDLKVGEELLQPCVNRETIWNILMNRLIQSVPAKLKE
jgi:hypothetical protein